MEAQKLIQHIERLTLTPCRPKACTRSFPVNRNVHTKQNFTRSATDVATETPSTTISDEEAASRDDDFPNTSPEDVSSLPATEKYAVIEIGGVQMFVQEGRWYNCNRLQAEAGQKIRLGRVLALKDSGTFHVGKPFLENARVTAEVVEELKGPKLTIFKMHSKKHYRRKTGHRQPLTQFYVTEIKL